MHGRLLMLVVLVTCTALSGQSPASYAHDSPPDSHADVPRFQRAPCPVPIGPDQVEGRTVTCGFVTVPEEQGRSDDPSGHGDSGEKHSSTGQSIRLAVAVFTSRNAVTGPPLVFLATGPGTAILQQWLPTMLIPS